jgi:flavodoxin
MNTQKIGEAIAEKINASIIDIKNNTESIELDSYDLIGFGAGIAGGKHYPKMLKYVEKLPNVQNKKAFIFSTSGTFSGKLMSKYHEALRNLLLKKGFVIVNEFGCKGSYATKLFKLKFNKGRPNADDIKNAEIFAEKLLT